MSPNSADSEHVVFHPNGGDAAFTRVPDLAKAVSLVEWLHNERGITDASVFALTPVRLAVRSYVRVEVAAAEAVESVSPRATARPFQSATSVGSGDLAAAAEALLATTDLAPVSSQLLVPAPTVEPDSSGPDLSVEALGEPVQVAPEEPALAGTVLPNQAKPRGLGFFVH